MQQSRRSSSMVLSTDGVDSSKALVEKILSRLSCSFRFDTFNPSGVDNLFSPFVQAYCAKTAARLKLFGNVLAAFYNADVVEDEDIKLWLLDSRSKYAADTPGDTCRKQGVILFKAIEAQSSEEEDDDDDEEEDEDEDD
jgi:eIF4-gamma/eIF5/eIF2-epsilon